MSDLTKFAKSINIEFKNRDLLKQAFIHRSYLNEHKEVALPHNERLEFLGDAVLELVVTDYLFQKYPGKQEGDLTAYRAALVNTVSISDVARDLGMNDYLLLSKGEARDTGRARQYILANTFESVIGAIYLDQGYEVAAKFIADNLFSKTDKIVSEELWQDSKSYFQEKAQDTFGVTPSYQVLDQVGPDHNKRFTVGLFIGEELVAKGEGHSKQEAEQNAASAGLKAKGWE
jgi:ribonuclease III